MNGYKQNSDPLEEMLRFDSLAEAEKMTGQSYKEDEATTWLGMAIGMSNADRKNAELRDRDDTLLSNDYDRYARIVGEMGFSKVLEVPFTSRYSEPERLEIWWHEDGLLLSFDTYRTEHVNGGKVYYNWRPNPDTERWRYTSSGHMRPDGVWVGDHDCREALRHNLGRLRSGGSFLVPWVERPWLWLLHHGETDLAPEPWKDRDAYYNRARAERVALLPEHVLAAITPEVTAQ